MEIRFVLPEEVEQLKRNVLTAFPSKTPDSLLQNMKSELHEPDEDVTSDVSMTTERYSAPF